MTSQNDDLASKPMFTFHGECPICEKPTVFVAYEAYFRNSLVCPHCWSLPRERALMTTLSRVVPGWHNLRIHESSPSPRGVSNRLQTECKSYVPTQFFPGVTLGSMEGGVRCEDLENQTFPAEAFDLVITQDVMEHVFEPAKVHQEIWRTLRPGGYHLFTTPVAGMIDKTIMKARRLSDGSIEYLTEPEYHGNPVGDGRALVTFLYGYDIADLIAKAAPFDVEVRRFNDQSRGILGQFTEVMICRKRG